MQKKSAALILSILVLSLIAINTAVMPQLHVFFDVGSMDGMYATGKSVGSALGSAFGSDIFEFIGIVLFLA